MNNLAEIEAADDALPPEQKQELMLFLAARLRAQGTRMPEPRKSSPRKFPSKNLLSARAEPLWRGGAGF